jgi:mono/diheme cytochrome c family protein
LKIRRMHPLSLGNKSISNRHKLLTGGIALLLAGCGEPTTGPTPSSTAASWRSVAGEILAADSSCTACHTAGPNTVRRLGVSRAPQILGETGIGSRLSPNAIRQRIGAHGGELGLRMPDLLHGLEAAEKKAAVEDLVNFLISQGGPIDPLNAAMEVSSVQISQGSTIWQSVGCTACHGVDPATAIGLEDLTTSWTHGSLASYLADPLVAHPGGRMPSLNLTDDEASSLAAYLLAGDGVLETIASRPGLQLHYFDGDFDGVGPIDKVGGSVDPIRIPVPGVGPHAGKDSFGLRLSGEIEIPATGVWNFYLTSDDGSGLKIDGKMIVDNGGIHGAIMQRGSATLDAGRHKIDIGLFEASGGEELSLSWSGPGIARQPVPAEAFFSDATVLAPDWDLFELDEESAQRGMLRFAKTGCGTCHVPEMPKLGELANIPPLSLLIAGRGCLAEEVPAAAPEYRFTAAERDLLDELIENVAALDEPLPSDLAVAHTMTRLNCIACHSRPDVGGPTAEARTRFASNDDAELGDEGRIPPALDGVGNKLQLNALRSTLAKGEKVRPYMKARMPVFGSEQTDDLVVHFAAADAIAADGREPKFDDARVAAGHALTGVDGVSCVQCHTVAGHPSLGVPAVDLASMHARIRPGWFRKHLLDPQKTNPGTRMTAFWGNGGTERIFPEYLGGDPTKQVDAIRAYLSLGESMPLPRGVVPDAGEYALIPIDEPILFGTFMRDVSPRTIAVGLPENVHYAWDAEHARLAKAWRGGFMDAEGTWRGRAGQLEDPEGRSTLQMPAGPAIAVLSTRDETWPEPFARDAAGIRNGAWRFAGTTRNRNRRPAFNSELDGVRITETPIPRLAQGGTRLVRRFTVGSDKGRGDLYMRAAVAASIVPAGGEGRERVWAINDERRVRITGAESFLREMPGGGMELLVKVPLSMVGREDVAFEGAFDVELSW